MQFHSMNCGKLSSAWTPGAMNFMILVGSLWTRCLNPRGYEFYDFGGESVDSVWLFWNQRVKENIRENVNFAMKFKIVLEVQHLFTIMCTCSLYDRCPRVKTISLCFKILFQSFQFYTW